jgi:uncharacterized membrane protein YoaK (UPF0700 family)
MNAPATSASSKPFNEDALKRGVASVKHPLTQALLVLTFTTGLVDAVSYLGLGRVFTANMTGNVVLLGLGIGGGGGLPVLAPAISLLAFLVGGGLGGVLVRRLNRRHPALVARALAIEVSLLAIAAILAAAGIRANKASGDVLIAILALAMGIRNATVRRLGVPDLTTTVLTMTLTGFAVESRLAGGSGQGSPRRIAAVLSMLLGALAGALLLKTHLYFPLVLAACLALTTWLLYVPAAIRIGRQEA